MNPWDDICLTNPCFASGRCSSHGKSFTCKCAVGLGGNNCKYLIKAPCLPYNPCLNNGKCDTIYRNGN